MRKQEKKGKGKGKVWSVIERHIYHNLKQYSIVSILFLIGIVVGVFFINHAEIGMKQQIGNEITTFLECLKTDYQIDDMNLLKQVMGNHMMLTFVMWFMGCMVIGIPIVYGVVAFRGFSLGYTISSILYTLGTGKGTLFCILSLVLQNILIIPATFALAVSAIKLYQSIMKDKRKENIKIEIMRHTIFSLFILAILIVASFLEVYGSNAMISACVKYF